MSGRQGQSVISWLMMLPLLVVPLIAVFGVPKVDLLSTPNAEGEEPEIELVLGEESSLADEMPPMPSGQMDPPLSKSKTTSGSTGNDDLNQDWANPFEDPSALDDSSQKTGNHTSSDAAGFVDPFAVQSQPGTDSPSGTDAKSPQNPFERMQPTSPTQPKADFGYSRNARPQSSRPHPETGTRRPDPAAISKWREAVARLNELGVEKYQLSQTEEPFVFLFACDLTHPDNPRITHRFQAEAGEPLQAVAKVIQQVETWSAQINNR